MELFKSEKNPEVYYYFTKKNKKLWMYRHKYYDSSGTRREKKKSSFKSEKDAIKALFEIQATILRGETKQIEYEHLTVSEWFDTWLEANSTKWKPLTIVQREVIIRLHIKPILGKYKLQKLDKTTYQRFFINSLAKKYAASTVRSIHTIFTIAINAAVEDEILHRNKFKGIALPSLRKKEAKKYLTPEELNIFLQCAQETENATVYTILLLIAYTGMRRGEALALRWSDINFKYNTINIIRTRSKAGTGSTKTLNSERTIKVDELVIAQLKSYQMTMKELLLSYGRKHQESNFVFLSMFSGEPLESGALEHPIKRIIKKTKLPYCTVHSLRHTHATILMNNGFPIKAIADRLGNTPQRIHTVYGHVLKETEDAIVDAFTLAINKSGAKSGANS
ncbi:tyrosine-type recombinase/integrase [Metasolibacillus meyeri]|uniref:tyrosine-type recombinase/integrase n=1 Tax=Metasolibacillus meyeri TaxID=1071052 RepID=UPI000D30D0ED|nr:site-specific integrase [Metasolibacillus meyeri]